MSRGTMENTHRWLWLSILAFAAFGWTFGSVGVQQLEVNDDLKPLVPRKEENERDAFIAGLLEKMTPEELVMQLHLTFGDSVVGPDFSQLNSLFPQATRYAPIGIIHDWYPLSPPPNSNSSPPPIPNFYNTVQSLNLNLSLSTPPFSSHTPIPFMQLGECLHGVGSFKQSMFPSPIGLAASWDEDLVWRVGRAVGSEARSVGIHACLCPVLDLGKEVRWGRVQEAWGEDLHLTTTLGVAFSLGLSKNASHSSPDAVIPVVKHFVGHGSPSGGINAAPYSGSGQREYMQEFFRPFKAVLGRGGGRGVMMAYHEFDSVPAHINPFFYDALNEWGFDGFVMADDNGMVMLQQRHSVSSGPADTISQWFNAGGGVQFYDFGLDLYVNTILSLLSNNTLSLSTLQSRARGVLNVKWDLGLFDSLLKGDSSSAPSSALASASSSSPASAPASSNSNSSLFIPPTIHYSPLNTQHAPLTLEAARKAIVLLENRDGVLPIRVGNDNDNDISRIALIGPFGDILNYGDYSGSWGASPVPSPEDSEGRAGTLREGILGYLRGGSGSRDAERNGVDLVTSAGANTWLYNAQYGIPAYLLSPPPSASSSSASSSTPSESTTTGDTPASTSANANANPSPNPNADLPTSHGLLGTYYASTDFTGQPIFSRVEAPNRDWGLYPPYGFNDAGESVILPSNNFSVIWEGEVEVPVFFVNNNSSDDTSSNDLNEINGFIGVAVGPNTTARLFLDDTLVASSSYPPFSTSPSSTFKSGTLLGNIPSLQFSIVNGTLSPPGAGRFKFEGGRRYKVRIEYQTWNLAVKLENVNSVNSQVGFWWNLVEQGGGEEAADQNGSGLSLPVRKAVELAKTSDLIILAVGANWNSDGESGDRGTLGLSVNQTELADAIFDLGIPVVLVLQGGRPFAIPQYYAKAAAVLNAFFPGQSGGQAIADVLFGAFNPGGRITLSVPYDVGSLPVYYNYHSTRHALNYTDVESFPYYYFGYGLSYTTFSTSNFNASSTGGSRTFASGETITFRVSVRNEGDMAGSYVAQVYLLARVSSIVRPLRQLVAFKRVYLEAGESQDVSMTLDVDEFLPIVNRKYEWELEMGDYTFALMENGGPLASTAVRVTMTCVG
ncbi:hypothetical protein D9758_017435 [Tetrapyrgos nigripes]|uniref:xylan 1,4-beta-xylosidase n=1 Tax=Tetrapyrgos nigripes TaxID=182062 RepID=A0A8H5FFV7_9AGAR|nr:hypothetical protein D9758_017435 [Tetrapyrgos nigripes]